MSNSDMLSGIKRLMELRKEAKRIETDLENKTIEVSDQAGVVKIVINGHQRISEVTIQREASTQEIAEAFRSAMNQAIEASQAYATNRMKGILQAT